VFSVRSEKKDLEKKRWRQLEMGQHRMAEMRAQSATALQNNASGRTAVKPLVMT